MESSGFKDERRTCLGFKCGRRFRLLVFDFCLRVLEAIVLITCCKKMGKLSEYKFPLYRGYNEQINRKSTKPNPRENRKTTKDNKKGKHPNPKSAKARRLNTKSSKAS